MKLSVNEAKLTCELGNVLQFNMFWFPKLPSPEELSRLLRNEPKAPVVKKVDNTIHWIMIYPVVGAIQCLSSPGKLPVSLLAPLAE